MDTKEPLSPEKTCKCGYSADHHMVTPKCTYTFLGLLWVTLVGVTTKPIKVSFQCRICKTIIAESTENHILDKYK